METRPGGQVAADQINGTIRKIKEGVWEARLYGGWYVGFGKTPDAAKKKVVKLYEKENQVTLCYS